MGVVNNALRQYIVTRGIFESSDSSSSVTKLLVGKGAAIGGYLVCNGAGALDPTTTNILMGNNAASVRGVAIISGIGTGSTAGNNIAFGGTEIDGYVVTCGNRAATAAVNGGMACDYFTSTSKADKGATALPGFGKERGNSCHLSNDSHTLVGNNSPRATCTRNSVSLNNRGHGVNVAVSVNYCRCCEHTAVVQLR